MRAVEAELCRLDDFLSAIVGPSANIALQCNATPGRTVTLRRADGVTVSLAVCPMTLSPENGAPFRYLVSLLAWAEVDGFRTWWHKGPQWMISLTTDADARAARPLIEGAWKQVLAVPRVEVLVSHHGQPAPPSP